MSNKEIVRYVKTWLQDNLDNDYPEGLREDSYNLLNKIYEMEESNGKRTIS